MAENQTLQYITGMLDLSNSSLCHDTPVRYNVSHSNIGADCLNVSTFPDVLELSNVTSNSTTPLNSTLEIVLISIVAGALSLFTMAGNLMVIMAFKLDKQLQTISNCFLLSLAVADFTIGFVSMPLYTVYLLMGHWPLGPFLCDLWLSLDYTMSNASVANLLCICFDRYLSVTRPLTYRANRTPRKVGIMIGCAWVISMALWTPWIFGWPHIEGNRTVPAKECYIQFLYTNAIITIVTALAAFYIPVSVMTILYYKIYRETERRQKRIPMLQASKLQLKNNRRSPCGPAEEEGTALSGPADLSPELDEYYEVSENTAKEPRTVWSRCCCMFVDRDYVPPEESSTSDPPGSPGLLQNSTTNHYQVTFRGNSKLYGNNRPASCIMNGKPRRNGSFNNFNLSMPMYLSESSKTSPIISPMTDTTTVGSRYSNISACADSCRDSTCQAGESNESMYTVMINFPRGGSTDRDTDKPSIKMFSDIDANLEEGEYNDSDCQEVQQYRGERDALVSPQRQYSEEDSDINDLTELKLNESSFINMPSCSSQPPGHTSESTYSSTESIRALTHPLKPPLPPPFGTPALGRRTRSFDAIKSASQARLVLRAANRAKHQRVRRKRQERRQDRKAAKTLSAILLAFIITWTPYNIFAVVGAFCRGCINPTLYAFGYWLCYINSGVNPLCYALCNANFRKTFWKILQCKCRKVNYGLSRHGGTTRNSAKLQGR